MQMARELYRESLAELFISRLFVGLHFTAVELSSGDCGLAMTEAERELKGIGSRRRVDGPCSPGCLTGRPVLDVLACSDERPLFNSIRWATLNACSSCIERLNDYRVETDRDVLDCIDGLEGKRVTLVGAFQTYLDRLLQLGCELRVLELRPGMIPQKYRHLHVVKKDVPRILTHSDLVIITGSTLVNQTLGDLLPLIRSSVPVALIGPSAGLFPSLLFQNGITIIGTIRVTDPDQVFKTISEGGTGYHLFGRCAKKIVILNDNSR